MQHRQAPPNAQLNTLNPKINQLLEGYSIVFPGDVSKSIGNNELIVTGVSSFGYSGTITHVILDNSHMRESSRRESCSSKDKHSNDLTPLGVLWQFTGQGTLKQNVAKHMYVTDLAFQQAMCTCDDILYPIIGYTASSLLYPDDSNKISLEESSRLLEDTRFAQPILVGLEYCIAQYWVSRGYIPDAVLGHSLGEYAAAVVSGVMTLSDCLRLVAGRAKLVYNCSECVGCMEAVRSSHVALQALLDDCDVGSSCSVAAINGEKNVVVSGSIESMTIVTIALETAGISHQKLRVNNGFHSPLMKHIADAYRSLLVEIDMKPPRFRWISTVRGYECGQDVTDPNYWIDHMINPVLYKDAIDYAWSNGMMNLSLEIGPDLTLSKLSKMNLASQMSKSTSCQFFTGVVSVGTVNDAELQLSKVKASNDLVMISGEKIMQNQYHPMKRFKTFASHHRLIQSLRREDFSELTVISSRLHHGILCDWLSDHVINESVVFPGAGLVELICAIVETRANLNRSKQNKVVLLEGLTITSPIRVLSDISLYEFTTITTVWKDNEDILIYSKDDINMENRLHAQGKVSFQYIAHDLSNKNNVDTSNWQKVDIINFYNDYSKLGLHYGPNFRLISAAYVEGSSCKCILMMPSKHLRYNYMLSPALIDCMLQSAALVLHNLTMENEGTNQAHIPYAFDNVKFYPDQIDSMWRFDHCSSLVTVKNITADMTILDCFLMSADGTVIIDMKDVYCRSIGSEKSSKHQDMTAPVTVDLYQDWVLSCNNSITMEKSNLIVLLQSCLIVNADSQLIKPKRYQACLLKSLVDRGLCRSDIIVEEVLLSNMIGSMSGGGVMSLESYDIIIIIDTNDSTIQLAEFLNLLGQLCKLTAAIIRFIPTEDNSCSTSLERTYNELYNAALTGAIVAAQTEYPLTHILTINHQTKGDKQIISTEAFFQQITEIIVNEIFIWDGEKEITYKESRRFIKRFKQVLSSSLTNKQILMSQRGSFDNLSLQKLNRFEDASLPEHSVEVHTFAISLNFRDVLNVLGMYPGDPGEP
eukprot:gene16671-22795_t